MDADVGGGNAGLNEAGCCRYQHLGNIWGADSEQQPPRLTQLSGGIVLTSAAEDDGGEEPRRCSSSSLSPIRAEKPRAAPPEEAGLSIIPLGHTGRLEGSANAGRDAPTAGKETGGRRLLLKLAPRLAASCIRVKPSTIRASTLTISFSVNLTEPKPAAVKNKSVTKKMFYLF